MNTYKYLSLGLFLILSLGFFTNAHSARATPMNCGLLAGKQLEQQKGVAVHLERRLDAHLGSMIRDEGLDISPHQFFLSLLTENGFDLHQLTSRADIEGTITLKVNKGQHVGKLFLTFRVYAAQRIKQFHVFDFRYERQSKRPESEARESDFEFVSIFRRAFTDSDLTPKAIKYLTAEAMRQKRVVSEGLGKYFFICFVPRSNAYFKITYSQRVLGEKRILTLIEAKMLSSSHILNSAKRDYVSAHLEQLRENAPQPYNRKFQGLDLAISTEDFIFHSSVLGIDRDTIIKAIKVPLLHHAYQAEQGNSHLTILQKTSEGRNASYMILKFVAKAGAKHFTLHDVGVVPVRGSVPKQALAEGQIVMEQGAGPLLPYSQKDQLEKRLRHEEVGSGFWHIVRVAYLGHHATDYLKVSYIWDSQTRSLKIVQIEPLWNGQMFHSSTLQFYGYAVYRSTYGKEITDFWVKSVGSYKVVGGVQLYLAHLFSQSSFEQMQQAFFSIKGGSLHLQKKGDLLLDCVGIAPTGEAYLFSLRRGSQDPSAAYVVKVMQPQPQLLREMLERDFMTLEDFFKLKPQETEIK